MGDRRPRPGGRPAHRPPHRDPRWAVTGQRPLLAAALAAAGRGWPVFPLAPYGKRPAVAGWPAVATRDPVRLERWWVRAPYNVGIACGPAGLLVVDLDQPRTAGARPPQEWAEVGDGWDVFAALAARAGADSVDTYTVATPRGEHRYYSVPVTAAGDRPDVARVGRNTAGVLGWLVDTRAAGGYVLAAGSVRRLDGRLVHYRQTSLEAPAPAPGWLLDDLTPSPPPAVGWVTVSRAAPYARAAVAGEVAAVRAATAGTRNSRLFTAAFRLGQLAAAGLLDPAEVAVVLKAAAAVHVGADGFTVAEAAQGGRQRPAVRIRASPARRWLRRFRLTGVAQGPVGRPEVSTPGRGRRR